LLWAAAVTAREAPDDAVALAARQQLEPLLEMIQDPYLHALCRLAMSWTSSITGEFDRALQEAAASLDELRRQDEPLWTAAALVTVGALETALGRYDDARRHLDSMRDLAERCDNARLIATSRVQLGTLAVMEGRLPAARALLNDALDMSRALHITRNVSLVLGALAALALLEGDPERGALLAGAAEGLRRRAGLRPWPMTQGQAELASRIRDTLGLGRFDEVYAAGGRLTQREAAAAARSQRTGSQPP
jgi:tetratricopeptide (TPR) repeat protein